MVLLSSKFVLPMAVLLVALAIVLPMTNGIQGVSDPCDADDAACKDILRVAAEEDGETPGLVLLQRTAAMVAKKNAVELQHTDVAVKTAVASKASSGMAPVFFDVKTMDYFQLTLVTMIYGYVLYVGSNMIGDGSELLMFFKSVAGIVGSVVVPILGAVPDAAMVLFSGIGPDAQKTVATGVGALVGSTVMLLTFPWFIVNMAGSVPLKSDGTADYKQNHEPAYLFTSGVTFGPSVGANAKIMCVTCLSFLIIQIPAFFVDKAGVSLADQAKTENIFALAGMIVSLVFFFGYIAIMYSAGSEDARLEVLIESIKSKQVSLATVLANLDDDEVDSNLPKILRCFFFEFDSDKSGCLDAKEFELVLKDLGEVVTPAQAQVIFNEQDKGKKDGTLSFDEFTQWAKNYKPSALTKLNSSKRQMPAYHDEDEEEEILPEDLMNEPIEVQQRAMFLRSFSLMGFGTLLVLLFADPAVDVFTEWGNRFGVSSFYVGFLLAPFASIASELLVALGYARAKTAKKITMSFESLVGAACMNNTLCLAVFFALVYFESLAWTFKAETAGIMIIQFLMAGIILASNTQRKIMGFFILLLYPFCLFIVYFLENVCGWD